MRHSDRRSSQERLLLAGVCLGGALFAWSVFARFAFEDAYITFRYAQNLALGHGLVFQPGDAVLGTSSPLWAVLLGTLGAVGIPIPWAAGALCSASVATTAYLGARMLQHHVAPAAGWVFALFVASGGLGVYDAWGMETPLFLALLLGAFCALERDRRRLAGALLGLACLARYEGIAFALPVVLYCLRTAQAVPRRQRLHRAGDVLVTAALVALPWWVYASATYGSPFPHTLAAKAGGTDPLGYLWLSLRELPYEWLGQVTPRVRGVDAPASALAWVLLAVVAALAALGVRRLSSTPSALPELFFGGLLVVLGLAAVGPGHCFRWHRLPVHLPALLVFSAGLGSVGHRLRVHPAWLRAVGIVGVVAVPLLLQARHAALTQVSYYASRVGAYDGVIATIQENGWREELLLTAEPGYITYHTGNPVIDAAGLVTKGISFGSDRRTPTTLGALLSRRPSLILARAPFHPEGYRVVFDGDFGCRLLRAKRSWGVASADQTPNESLLERSITDE